MISFIVFTLLIAFLLSSVYILIRNNFVYEFVTSLNETCYQVCLNHINKIYDYSNLEDYRKEHERLEDIWKSISEISYEKLLYSFKPLKPKYWLNEEQLNFINNS